MSTEPETRPGRAFTMSRDDAIFLLGVAVFSAGLYVVTDHPVYGLALIAIGICLLGWAARSHASRTLYKTGSFVGAVLLMWGIAYIYERVNAVPSVELTPSSEANTGPSTEPIAWSSRLLFYPDGDKKIRYIVLYGTNNGSTTEQLKTATLSSYLTGDMRDFSVELPAHRIDAQQKTLQDVNIPPGAEVELIIEWNPTISVTDFMGQWGKARLEIGYGTTTYKRIFDHENIASMLAQDIAGADAIVGPPRATPKGR